MSADEEAIVVAFRRHTMLPLDDFLYALQPTIPHLTRSSLHRCLQHHGVSRLPDTDGVCGVLIWLRGRETSESCLSVARSDVGWAFYSKTP